MMKLRGPANTLDVCTAIQKDLNRLKKWADMNLMKFNNGKCRVLTLGRNNPMHKYILEGNFLGCVKGVLPAD